MEVVQAQEQVKAGHPAARAAVAAGVHPAILVLVETGRVPPATRRRMMSGIRGKNTAPEMLVRKYLHSRGFRYRLHAKELPGKPDIVLPKYRTVVFVHGCFWHQHPGCKFAVMPRSNTEFWQRKLGGNTARHTAHLARLDEIGWRCIVIWECNAGDAAFLKDVADSIRS